MTCVFQPRGAVPEALPFAERRCGLDQVDPRRAADAPDPTNRWLQRQDRCELPRCGRSRRRGWQQCAPLPPHSPRCCANRPDPRRERTDSSADSKLVFTKPTSTPCRPWLTVWSVSAHTAFLATAEEVANKDWDAVTAKASSFVSAVKAWQDANPSPSL